MKIILSLANPQLVELACHSKADMIRTGPHPGEDLCYWGVEDVMVAIDLIVGSGKVAQVRLPVCPSPTGPETGVLLERLAAKPEVELIIGAWHQIAWDIPNPKVAGENLNITNSDEVRLLSQRGVHIITFPPRWSPDVGFWENVPDTSRFERHIKGPIHVGWLWLTGQPDGGLTPVSTDNGSLPFRIERGQLWSKFIHPIMENNPQITRNIVEYSSLDELTEGPE